MMQAAQAVNQPVMRLPSFRPTEAVQGRRIAVYSEPLFAIILSASLNHAIIEPAYDWLTMLPDHYTQRQICYTTIGAVRSMTMPRFIKNADGLKGFDVKVYASQAELPPVDFYPEDYPVLVAEPVTWEVEYRCFVLERQITTLSIYLRQGVIARDEDGNWFHQPEQMVEASAFCQTLLADSAVPIPPACVIDVGIIAGRGWAVVEANPAYGSGIYGCEPGAILPVINRACIPIDQLTNEDRDWIKKYEVSD